MHPGCHVLGRVAAFHGAFCLEEHAAVVELCVGHMHRYARFLVAACQHVLVHVYAVHSLAAVQRQQRGVYVDNAVVVCLEQVFGHEEQEAGEHDNVGVCLAQRGEHFLAVAEHAFGYVFRPHSQALGTQAHPGFFSVVHEQCYFCRAAVFKVAYYVFGVCAFARSEDG